MGGSGTASRDGQTASGELQSGERRKAASIVSEFNWSKEKKHHGRAHMNPLIGGKSIG
jgi:hypothetical protein